MNSFLGEFITSCFIFRCALYLRFLFFRIFVLYLFNLGVLTYSLYTLSQNCGEVVMMINRSFINFFNEFLFDNRIAAGKL